MAFFVVLVCFPGPRPVDLSLVSQELLAGLVSSQLVDVFHENPLVFEHVSLHLQVQAAIHVMVILSFTVSSEQLVQNLHTSWPGCLLWQVLTFAHMPALPACQDVCPALSLGMDSHSTTIILQNMSHFEFG